jgi:hypothetical protein
MFKGLVSEILVDREKAVISGPKAAIATAIAAQALNGEVRSFVREWRKGQSARNLLPLSKLFRAASMPGSSRRSDIAVENAA